VARPDPTDEVYDGPTTVDCPMRCPVPAPHRLVRLNVRPEDVRHRWTDIFVCPNGCGRVFMLRPHRETQGAPEGTP